jgi:hypothetical protein
MKKKFIPVYFSKKKRKATTKTAPASAAYAPTMHGKYMFFLSIFALRYQVD